MFLRFCVFFFLLCSALFADNAYRYNLSVVALIKNEAKYLKEWIEYHLLAGVDHFYLYDIGSTDHLLKVLRPYMNKQIVTLVRWPVVIPENEDEIFNWALGLQIPAYENASRYLAIKETKWIVYLDTDEFLTCSPPSSIRDILEKYQNYPGVTLTCNYFDVNAKKDHIPRRKLLIETLELTHAPKKNLFKTVAKTIFKPSLYKGFHWPPYQCIFQQDRVPIAAAKRELRINHYLNRNEGYFYARAKHPLHIDNRLLTEDQIEELLSLDYEIEDQDRAIYRFVPELLIRMGYDPTWGW